MDELLKYKYAFSNLHVKITYGMRSPNKAIMLISVIDLIRRGFISSNRIHLEDAIEEAFSFNWQAYFPQIKVPSPWTPFWHLKNEPFWHFEPYRSNSEIENLVGPGETASFHKMRYAIQYAYFDNELFELLKMKNDRDELLSCLLKYCKVS